MSVLPSIGPHLTAVENMLGYKFQRPQLVFEALMMGYGWGGQGAVSVTYYVLMCGMEINTRLAIIGARALEWCLAEVEKGINDKRRDKLLSSWLLNHHARACGLDKYIFLNPGHSAGDTSDKIVAATLEALVGAIWRDRNGGEQGFFVVDRVIEQLKFFDHSSP
ncbi:hypothetical protein K458DRAFT_405219 [Lentithecium fluviatile CBS 122367]|uniref:RNase III domain-containing protein n=1 Tax=Lentithecium fluviatile CBS 122367 TaxID=1168545 RepID=A0A6G1IXV2_9PLEO|nr:hypothetical protein K458DRAFT_405219 [Lentithecium fluviatile CBS 122367]